MQIFTPLLLSCLCLSGAAWAQSPSVPPSPGAWSVGAETGSARYRSRETNAQGTVVNRESGSLPSLRVHARWDHTPWFAQLSMQRAASDVAYSGFTQLGLPIRTTTALAISGWQGLGGWRYALTERQTLELGAGLSQRRIDRNILPTLGSLPLREVLNTRQLVLAAAWQVQLPQTLPWPLTLGLSAKALPALRQTLDVDSFGIYDPVQLRAARGTDWTLAANAQVAITPQLRATLGWQAQSIRPGASSTDIWRKNGVAVATVRYPGSKQSTQSLLLGIQAAF